MASQQEVDLGIKKWIFSSTVFTIQAFLFCGLYQKPSEPERNVRQKGGRADAFTPTLKLSVTWWYLRMQICITLLNSDMRVLAVKAFSVNCLVFIIQYRLLLRHKGLPLSMTVVTAWMTLWEQSGQSGHDFIDVKGWRWGRNLWDYS